jgi:hypothetical protein
MEELLMRVLERFTGRIITRQRAMYEAPDVPFIEKWRTAMRYIDEDLAAGYPKIWYELQAMAWNRPDFRERIAHVAATWDDVLGTAIEKAQDEYGIDRTRFPTDALATLVRTFNAGILLERLSGISTGHDALLEMIDRWMTSLEEQRER